jgi:hypothetical protein
MHPLSHQTPPRRLAFVALLAVVLALTLWLSRLLCRRKIFLRV